MAEPAKTNTRAVAPVADRMPTSARPLSARQVDALRFIAAYVEEFGQSPSLRELASGLRTSHAYAHAVIQALERKGYVAHRFGVPRGLRVLRACPEAEMSQRVLRMNRARRSGAKGGG